MDILFTISEASDAFDKIETKLRNFGYVFDSSNIEHHKDRVGKDKYIKEYKIKQFGAEYIKDLAPELKICITAYMDGDDKVYHLDATIGYAIWSASDTNLQSVIDNYVSAAYLDIIDFYIEADYLDFISDENLETKSSESLINSIDLDGLDKQIKESNDSDSDSLEDLNAKVDTILDALGLVNEDENNTDDKESVDNNKESVDDIDINVSTENDEINKDDDEDNNNIPIIKEESTDDVDNIDNI